MATLEWLFWQVAGLGPSMGQANHFLHQAPDKISYATERYITETQRLFTVLNHQLINQDFIASDYSIADIASFPWIARHEQLSINLENYSYLYRWYKNIGKRPAVQRAYQIASEMNPTMVLPKFN